MPAIKVFDFAQKVKEYVHDILQHTSWKVITVVVVYSTRVKQTKFGYKVIPLEVGVIATDTGANRQGAPIPKAKEPIKCRIKFSEICNMFGCDSYSFPYISVSNNKDNTRTIFDEGFTYLSIDCSKENNYKGYPCYSHKTASINNERLAKLNKDVLETINERLNELHEMTRKQYEDSLNELLNEEDN